MRLPVVQRRLGERGDPGDARVVDDDVEPAERAHRLRASGASTAGYAATSVVSDQRPHARAARPDARSPRDRPWRARPRDVGAGLGQRHRDRAPETPAGPGDDRDLAGERPRHRASIRRAPRCSFLYLSETTLRLTLSVGVSSPPSSVKSIGRIVNFLILAYDCSCVFFSSTVRPTRSTIFGCLTSAAASVVRMPVLARELRQLLGVQRDERHRVRAPVAVDHDLADEGIGLEEVLDVLRRDVHAAGGDDEVLLAVGDEQEAVLVDRARCRRCGTSRPARTPRASPPAA